MDDRIDTGRRMLIEQKWEVWKAEISILIPRLNQHHLPSRDCKVSYRARIMTKRLSLSFNHSVNLKDMLHDTAELCRWRLGKKEEKISKDEGESNGVIPYTPSSTSMKHALTKLGFYHYISFFKLYHHKGLMGGHGLGSLNMRGAEPLKQVRAAESSHETSSRQGEISNAYKFENWLVWLRYRSRKEQILVSRSQTTRLRDLLWQVTTQGVRYSVCSLISRASVKP